MNVGETHGFFACTKGRRGSFALAELVAQVHCYVVSIILMQAGPKFDGIKFRVFLSNVQQAQLAQTSLLCMQKIMRFTNIYC